MVSDEEQLASNVGLHSTLSPSCLCSSSESELSSLKVRYSGGFGTGSSLLCGTCLIADGKSGYFTVCLDLEVILVMSVKRKFQSDEWSFGSLQTKGTVNDIWCEPFTHAKEALHTLCNKYKGPNFLCWCPTLHPK